MFHKIIANIARLATPVRSLLTRSTNNDTSALESYLSQAQSIAHLESLQRSWDRRQDRGFGLGNQAQWS